MSVRDTEEYKNMTNAKAVEYAEDWFDTATQDQMLAAWQYLEDTGYWRNLQGWFGRTLSSLREAGVILRRE